MIILLFVLILIWGVCLIFNDLASKNYNILQVRAAFAHTCFAACTLSPTKDGGPQCVLHMPVEEPLSTWRCR